MPEAGNEADGMTMSFVCFSFLLQTITSLGGELAGSLSDCTVLVTDKVRAQWFSVSQPFQGYHSLAIDLWNWRALRSWVFSPKFGNLSSQLCGEFRPPSVSWCCKLLKEEGKKPDWHNLKWIEIEKSKLDWIRIRTRDLWIIVPRLGPGLSSPMMASSQVVHYSSVGWGAHQKLYFLMSSYFSRTSWTRLLHSFLFCIFSIKCCFSIPVLPHSWST